VRRWRDGSIGDAAYAVASPQHVSGDLHQARRLLELVPSVPPFRWGRDELRTGDMWNSNSVVSWLLAGSGLPAERIQPPHGGRAPGWRAGLELARSTSPCRETHLLPVEDTRERGREPRPGRANFGIE
jgi:hypothetical protein